MASNKPRNKKYNRNRSKARHITTIINQCLAKFQIIGDQNHFPLAFHYAGLSTHLKGMDLAVGLGEVNKFLCEDLHSWTILFLAFYKTEESVETVPVRVVYEDHNLQLLGENFEGYRKDVFESLADAGYEESEMTFYGYFITYGDDLNIDTIESQLSEKFLRVTNNLTNIGSEQVVVTKENMLEALKRDKFSITNSSALSTDYTLVTDEE